MISANSLTTNYFFDHRGNTIEESDPGGLVTKMRYDSVGRKTVSYTTDGGSGTDWNAANTVVGDIVLDQLGDAGVLARFIGRKTDHFHRAGE